jgi:chorismate dehydratase
MKAGYIDYLNCYPFYHKIFQKGGVPGVEISAGYPEFLNSAAMRGELDLTPVSSAAYPSMQNDVLLLPDFCLSSEGYVRSVTLLSRMPIEELDGARVGLTTASRTSVVLLKILLEKHYGLKPEYSPANPRPSLDGLDAMLVIGNDAMTEPDEPVQYMYDLGDLWMRKTGFPVVFAVFIVRKSSVEANRAAIRDMLASFRESLDELKNNDAELIQCAAARYPGINYDIRHYYSLLKYDFTDRMKEALAFYFSEAASLGLLPQVNELGFLGPV